MQVTAPVHSLPEVDDPLVQVIDGVYRVGGENATCGLFAWVSKLITVVYTLHVNDLTVSTID